MALPLFVADEATLKASLRLSAVPASATDTEAIIDEAILRARLRFYRTLGTGRVTAILATAYTDQPTTEDEVIRALAATVEVKMVHCQLLRALPNTYMDASGDVNARWNEEAPTRERGFSELDAELMRCEREITAALDDLIEPDLGGCTGLKVYDGTPDLQTSFPPNTPRVGLTLKPPYHSRRPSTD